MNPGFPFPKLIPGDILVSSYDTKFLSDGQCLIIGYGQVEYIDTDNNFVWSYPVWNMRTNQKYRAVLSAFCNWKVHYQQYQLFPIMHPGDLMTDKQAVGTPRIYLILSEGKLQLFARSKYDSSRLNPKPAEIPIYSYYPYTMSSCK